MSINRLNVISSGDNVSSGRPVLQASASDKDSTMRYVQPFGWDFGTADGYPDFYQKDVATWNGGVAIGSPSGAGLAQVAPTASSSLALQLSSGTANSTGEQYQQRGHGSSNVTTPFFVRNGLDGNPNHISGLFKFQWSNNDLTFLLGVTDSTTQLTTAGAINGTDGLFLYHAGGTTNLTAYVRSGGSTVYSANLDTACVAGTWRWFGFILDPLQAILQLDVAGVLTETGISFATSPAAALGVTLAAVNTTANNRTLTLQRLGCQQEAYY